MLRSLFPVAPLWGWRGFLFCGLSSGVHQAWVCAATRSGPRLEMQRVAVFIDWQNAYQQARAAFGLVGSGHEGQFSPLRLGQLLAARNRRGKDGHLVRVEVYRGQPLSNVDPIGHAAVALQAQAWKAEAPGVVVAQLRPLAKQDDGRFVEKGVDVHLAVELLYRDGICAGMLHGADGENRADEVSVPLAHQSALAGVLLAIEFFVACSPDLRAHRPALPELRYDVLRDNPQEMPAPSSRREGCICEDTDFLETYATRWMR
jgi:hypothetical protein